MNLTALWAYGAGITTGIIWPHAKRRYLAQGVYHHLATRLYLVVALLLLWPIFAVYVALDPKCEQLNKP